MSDDRSTFEMTRARLEDIVVQVKRKDVSLEQSLDLLEEAVRLVNQCNDLIDQTSFRAAAPGQAEGAEVASGEAAPDEGQEEGTEAVPGEDGEPEATEPGDVDVLEVVEVVEVIVPDDDGYSDAWAEEDVAPPAEMEDDARE